MPNLNRLAQQSCIFDDAHCSEPICTPSRGTLMTGLYPHAHGAVGLNTPLQPDVRCLPELLPPEARAAYRVEYHGKWHLGDELFAQHGYERFVSVEDIYWSHFSERRNPGDRSDYHHFLLDAGFSLGVGTTFPRKFAAQLPEPYSKPKFQADRACEFIRQHRDQPWMLTVSMLDPHMPFTSCRDGQYDPADVPLFSNYDHVPDACTESAPVPEPIRNRLASCREQGYEGHDLNTEVGWRTLIARYLGLCSLVDTHIGRILRTLEACGLDDNTIVVFTSDHGEMMRSHRLLQKNLLYREATAVPLLVRLPVQTRSVRLTGPVSQVDVTPTLLDLLGHAPDTELHGRSLAEPMRDAAHGTGHEVSVADEASPCVVVQHDTSRCLISRDGWRYSHYLQTGEVELYDLNRDPGERTNLATDPAHAQQLARLHEALLPWQVKTGAPEALTQPSSVWFVLLNRL